MNWCNMYFHGTILKTAVLTNVTFEWLLSFMHRCNMLFMRPFWEEVLSEMSHLTSDSWKTWPLQYIAMCCDGQFFYESDVQWFFSLMNCSYVFNQSYLIWVSLPHISHLNFFFPSYIDETFLLDFFRMSSISIFLFNLLTGTQSIKEGNDLVSVAFYCYD